VKSRPIIFSGPMVRAILADNKTQTRRVVKHSRDMEFDPQDPHYGPYWLSYAAGDAMGEDAKVRCPYGQPGDRLWVRETFMPMPHLNAKAFYRATDRLVGGKWKPSIFMPRELSRITLEVLAVRVERLQSITEEDAWEEGIDKIAAENDWLDGNPDQGRQNFKLLWESINGVGSWDLNPWVWVVEFRRVEGGKA
jgi:hypothetical protein